MTTIDVTGISETVASVDEKIMQALPVIAGLVGFIPGASAAVVFEPVVMEILQVVDAAAKNIAANNPGAAFQDIFDELKNHLTKGQPDSPALAPTEAAHP